MTLPESLKKAVDEAIDKLHSPDGSIVLLSGEVDDLKSSVYDVVASFLEAKRKELKKVIQTRIAERTTEGLFGGAEKISIQEIMDIIRAEITAVFGGERK